jgi:hypothetical protein
VLAIHSDDPFTSPLGQNLMKTCDDPTVAAVILWNNCGGAPYINIITNYTFDVHAAAQPNRGAGSMATHWPDGCTRVSFTANKPIHEILEYLENN